MNNKKTTKRALISSMLSLVVCVSMLIGTTFAWFTDTATSGVNTIQSGKLDVVLEYSTDNGVTWADAEGETLNFKTADGRTTDILWEPGCTYELPLLRVRNNGNLALKYHMVVNGVDGDAKLLEVIEWTANEAALTTFSGELDKNGDTSEAILIKGHMKESAGNEYQDLTLNGIGITVYANQNTVETDSYDEHYDKMATIDDIDELKAALAEKSVEIVFGSDIALEETIVIAADQKVKFDLNGHKISGTSTATDKNAYLVEVDGSLTVVNGTVTTQHTGTDMGWSNCTAVFHLDFDGKLNIENATVENLGGTAMAYAIDITNVYADDDSKLAIDNSNLKSSYIAVRVFNNGNGVHNVDIANSVLSGKFAFWVQYYADADFNDAADAALKRGNLNVDIYNKNNTFICAEGKVSPIFYGFDEYTYFNEAGMIIIENTEDLADALANGDDVVLSQDISDAPVNSVAPYGNYYGVALNGGVLDGNGNTLDFDIGELKNGKADNYGIMTSGGTIKNATITGVFRGIMIMNPTEDVIIDNVTIGDEDVCYAINTGEGDGTHKLIVKNSTIKGWSSYGTAVKSVSFTNCTFAQGEYYTDVFGRLVKPYVDTVFDSCEFNSKFYIDLSQLGKDGDGNVLNPDAKIVLKNCTVNGVKLTADNWKELIVSESACGEGQISVELKDGSYLTASNSADYVIIQ